MSKGSKQRPKQITQEELDRRWNLAFGKELTTPAFKDTWEEEQRDTPSGTSLCEDTSMVVKGSKGNQQTLGDN